MGNTQSDITHLMSKIDQGIVYDPDFKNEISDHLFLNIMGIHDKYLFFEILKSL